MTHFHYYATTAGKTDRVLQYLIYPACVILSSLVCKNSRKAHVMSQAMTATCSSLLTSSFFGLESNMIDQDSRLAVATEMGVDPKDVKFADYKYSGNVIVRRAYEDLMHLQQGRYLTDAMFLLPTALGLVSKAYSGKPHNDTHVIPPIVNTKGHPPINVNDLIRDVGPGLAAKSAYWFYETFMVEKTSHYEVVKIRENLESTGRTIKKDDLLSVYQRACDDRHERRIELNDGEAYKAVMPLMEKMADAYNKHDGKFGMSEIVYLIGMNKIHIYAEDGKTISEDAIKRSNAEIDRVLDIGLTGIRKLNQKRVEQGLLPEGLSEGHHARSVPRKVHSESFVDSLVSGAASTSQFILKKVGILPDRPEEYITRRDPGEVPSLASRNDGINFTAGRS